MMKTRSIHQVVKISALLALILAALSASAQTARADVGPKPSMEFEFVYETDTALTIQEGVQLECDDAACSDAQALEEAGPQRLTCTRTTCSSMAYGYSDYHRLVITFSDGVTRKSNVFTKSHFAAEYRVTVRENDLRVEETGGSANLWLFLLMGGVVTAIVGVICIGLLVLALLGVLILLIVRAGQDKASFETSRWLFVLAWIIMLPFLVIGSLISLALPLTVMVEGLVGLVYATRQKRPRFTLLSLVTLVNLLTQPCLLFLLMSQSDGLNLAYLGLAEGVIWLLEAALLYVLQRKTLSFRESLGLSALLNGTSFVIGLLLPL
jgi:hypothetical protein